MRTGGIAALSALLIALGGFGAAHGSVRADFSGQLLVEHNRARDAQGLPPLAWSQQLAGEAQEWAEVLAREGRMRHADRTTRKGAGENLFYGSTGYYGAEVMVGAFLAEERNFRPGAFPDVSNTGKWEDVGHYSQIIWPNTQQVGCAVASNRENDFLVCRYWPAGNIWGQRVGS